MHDISTEMIETPPMDDSVLVGGCHGLVFVPAAQLKDYYRGQGSVAAAGFVLLLLALASLL
ncbi:hypothetical protein C7T35_38695 [Variovorax sp. WS11]|nr:hypothetical protein C7T35_38695 [Variovorax sp. WS11]